MSKYFSVIFLWVLAAGWLAGQSLSHTELPAPPPTGLSDMDGVLGANSDAQRRVAEMIEKLHKERGYRLFVVLERSLISSNPNDMAAQMQEAWLPDGGGLVVVYESDTRNVGLGQNLDPGEGMRRGEVGVPAYELLRIITQALGDAGKTEGAVQPEVYVEAMVGGICREVEVYFARKEAPVESGRSLRLALVTVGALSLLVLCGMGLGWLMGRVDSRRQAAIRFFPEIDIPERLGAPYGGGCGGSGSFGQRRK